MPAPWLLSGQGMYWLLLAGRSPGTSAHSKVALATSGWVWYWKVTLVQTSAPSVGPAVITAIGPVVSTVQLKVAGVGSTAPFRVASTARTCGPPASPVSVSGEAQGVNAPASSEQRKVAPAWSELKVNVAVDTVDTALGPVRMVVFGVSCMTVQVWVAGVGSTLPAGSVASTAKVCGPSASPV